MTFGRCGESPPGEPGAEAKGSDGGAETTEGGSMCESRSDAEDAQGFSETVVPATMGNNSFWQMPVVWMPMVSMEPMAPEPHGKAPAKKKNKEGWQPEETPMTTVLVRNIPNNIRKDQFLRVLDAQGFYAEFDFVYLPIDFARRANLGYAFVNLVSSEAAVRFRETFQGFSRWGTTSSSKVCDVQWCSSSNNLEEHIEKYRNSPLMHEAIPAYCQPAVFKDGVQIPFPSPTKILRKPRFKNYIKHTKEPFWKQGAAAIGRCGAKP